MNQISHLYQLQVIDTGILNIQNRLHEIDSILLADKSIKKAETILQNKNGASELIKKKLNNIEDSVRSIEEKIKNNENALYGGNVKNPKELQDLQSENESLKRRVSSIEEDQLEAMIELEHAEKELVQAKDHLADTQSSFATHQSTLVGEKNQLEKKLENLQTERQALLGSIQQENFEIYQKLSKKKNNVAIVHIEDDSCPACGTTIRPYELQAARSPHQIIYCSTCGRILYAT